jgi:hypothetical protein
MGAAGVVAFASCALAVPPTARMLFKCACDMILILERSFRYQGKYVSVKQIEDAAVYYTTAMTTTFAGKELLLQKHVHDEVDRLVPLTKVTAGIKFSKLRPGLEDIIYKNRFLKTEPDKSSQSRPMVAEIGGTQIAELEGVQSPVELPGAKRQPTELPAEDVKLPLSVSDKEVFSSGYGSTSGTNTTADDLLSLEERTTISQTRSDQSLTATPQTTQSPTTATEMGVERTKSDNMFSRSTRKWSSKLGLRKSKTLSE